MALFLRTVWGKVSRRRRAPPEQMRTLCAEDEEAVRERLQADSGEEAETAAGEAPADRQTPSGSSRHPPSADSSLRAALLNPATRSPRSRRAAVKMAEARESPDRPDAGSETSSADHRGKSDADKKTEEDEAERPKTCWGKFKHVMRKLSKFVTSVLGMLILLIAYSFLGAVIFMHIEGPHESRLLRRNINVTVSREALLDDLSNASTALSNGVLNDTAWRQLVLEKLQRHEAEVRTAGDDGVYVEEASWTFWGSLFYCGTVFTTIGYGNIAPRTDLGKVVTMLYATVGIPLALLTLADLGKRFTIALKFLWAFVRRYYYTGYCRKIRRHSKQYDLQDPEKGGEGEHAHNGEEVRPGVRVFYGYEISEDFNLPITVASIICFLYILLGAVMYSLWEEWTYLDAFYFVFISMSTIGFGDITPDHPKFFLLSFIYIFIGLSLVSMCINVAIEVFTKTLDKAKVQIDKVTDKAKEQIGELDKSLQRARDKIHKRGSQEGLDRTSHKGSKEKLCGREGSNGSRGSSKDREVPSLRPVKEDENGPETLTPVTSTKASPDSEGQGHTSKVQKINVQGIPNGEKP